MFVMASAHVDGETYMKETKTGSTRTVVVPRFVMDVAAQYLTEQKKQCLILGDRWQGYGGRNLKRILFLFRKTENKWTLEATP